MWDGFAAGLNLKTQLCASRVIFLYFLLKLLNKNFIKLADELSSGGLVFSFSGLKFEFVETFPK